MVDSDKIVGTLLADGLVPADGPGDADLVVVNTCAFIEAAREESIETILALASARKDGAALVATGCLAERSGAELAEALPELDAVVGFAGSRRSRPRSAWPTRRRRCASGARRPGVRDLLELPRRARRAVGLREDRRGLRPRVRSAPSRRSAASSDRAGPEAIEAEVRALVEHGVAEIVLVAQDLAWYGRDADEPGSLVPLLRRLDGLAPARPVARPAALPLPVRGARPARLDDARAADGRALLRPLAAARVGAVVAGDEALGRR